MLDKFGYATAEQVSSRFFPEAVLAKPKAILECYEDIPCNPCVTSCPTGAITIGPDINKQPILDPDKCTGCAVCVGACPGLAIMVAQIKDNRAWFKIPHEFLPHPAKNDLWDAAARDGTIIGVAKIEGVVLSLKTKTAIVTVSIEKAQLLRFATVVNRHA